MLSGCVYPHFPGRSLPSRILSLFGTETRCDAGRERLYIHIGVGSVVVRSDELGNLRASECGTGNGYGTPTLEPKGYS